MGTWRRLAAVAGAAALLVAAACGDDADQADDGDKDVKTGKPGDFAATPGYLSKVVDQVEGESYRFEMDMTMAIMGQDIDLDNIATGEASGEVMHTQMDMGAMLDQMLGAFPEDEGDVPDELLDADLSIEYIVGPEDMYIRAPFFTALGQEMPAGEDFGEGGALVESLISLGDSWGHVDLTALGDVLPGEAAGALGGGQSMDPQMFLDLIKESGEVEELGTETIDGVEVNGLAADVSISQLLEAQNMDPAQLGADGDVGFPVEVWVDGDGLIRRVGFSFDAEALAEAAGEAIDDMDVGSEMGDFSMSMSMDFLDYGDDSIAIEEPSGDDVIDITEDFVAGYEELSEMSVDMDSLTES